MTSDQAKVRIQMVHLILCGVEAGRSLRSNDKIEELEAKMATIGKTIPSEQDMQNKLQRVAEMLRELHEVNLTPSAKKIVKNLASRYYAEIAIRVG